MYLFYIYYNIYLFILCIYYITYFSMLQKVYLKICIKVCPKLVLFSQLNYKVINYVFEGRLKKLIRNSQQLCEFAILWLYHTHVDKQFNLMIQAVKWVSRVILVNKQRWWTQGHREDAESSLVWWTRANLFLFISAKDCVNSWVTSDINGG